MKNLVLLLLCVVVVSGCTTTDAVRLDDSIRYGPSESVSILNEPPAQPYEVISMLESRGSVGQSLPDLLRSMKKRARELGADAIIPTDERSEYKEPGFIYNQLIGGYQSLPGGRVPILRGYAIIYESNKAKRAASYQSPELSGGVAVNALPFAFGGYGVEVWAGTRRFRAVGEIYSLTTPQAFLRDGFENGEIETAYRLSGNYFLMRNLDGVYFSTGLEYSTNSVGYENVNARGEWEALFLSAGIGYLLPINRFLHIDARLSVNARLTGENEIDVGGRTFQPDTATPAGFIGVGVNF